MICAKHGKPCVWRTPELFRFVLMADGKTGEIIGHQLHPGIKKFAVGVLSFVAHKARKASASRHTNIHAGQRHVSFSADPPIPEPSGKEITDYLVPFEEFDRLAVTAGAMPRTLGATAVSRCGATLPRSRAGEPAPPSATPPFGV